MRLSMCDFSLINVCHACVNVFLINRLYLAGPAIDTLYTLIYIRRTQNIFYNSGNLVFIKRNVI